MVQNDENFIIIGKNKYPIIEKELNQEDLKFYPENPRIYSLIQSKASDNPTQEEIQDILSSEEDLRELEYSIGQNGGLIEPLIVKSGDMIVLEGNRRLAAYRNLYKKNPISFAKVKCKILPENISEDVVFALLGQIHIVKRKDWNPFEQASYLYRMIKSSNKDVSTLAKSLGIQESKANNLLRNYEFMLSKKDLVPEHWSYYDEYLKSRSINKYRETMPNLDDRFTDIVKNGELTEARDVRKLAEIAKNPDRLAKKVMRDIADGNLSVGDGYIKIEEKGVSGKAYQSLNNFRKKIECDEFEKDLAQTKEGNVAFELKKILHRVEQLLKKYT